MDDFIMWLSGTGMLDAFFISRFMVLIIGMNAISSIFDTLMRGVNQK